MIYLPRTAIRSSGATLPQDEDLDIVRSYMRTEPYRKAIRKRKVWVGPPFAKGKPWHGMGRFRKWTLGKVNVEGLMVVAAGRIRARPYPT